MRGRRLWRDREPLVHRPTLIRLEMAVGDPAQSLGRDDPAERFAVERKHLAQASVKHQRLVAEDEELVEGKARRRGDVRHIGRQAIDAAGDFADFGFHEFLQHNKPDDAVEVMVQAVDGAKCSLGRRSGAPCPDRSGTHFKDHVERRLGRAAEALEARFSRDLTQPAFARLRAEPQTDFLGE